MGRAIPGSRRWLRRPRVPTPLSKHSPLSSVSLSSLSLWSSCWSTFYWLWIDTAHYFSLPSALLRTYYRMHDSFTCAFIYTLLLCTVKGVAVKKETGKIADSVNKILMGYVCKGKGMFKEKKTIRCISISYNAGSFQIAVSFICAFR